MAPARRKRSRTAPWRWTGLKGRTRRASTATANAGAVAAAAAIAAQPTKEAAQAATALRRDPTPAEQAVDWAAMDAVFLAAREALVRAWQPVRERQIEELVRKVKATTSLEALVRVTATAEGADVIAATLHELADFGSAAVVQEAAAQGWSGAAPDLADVKAELTVRATAVADALTRSLSEAAGREALANAGGALTATEVASEVADHLGGLSNAFLEEQFGGAAQAGLNAGRVATMDTLPDGTVYLGSALLDTNTCGPCSEDDGREWSSLEEARHTYPVAGHVDCLGRLRCRCTIVAQLPIEAPASVQ